MTPGTAPRGQGIPGCAVPEIGRNHAMNAYKLLVATHVLAGTIALVTFWMAALLRKFT